MRWIKVHSRKENCSETFELTSVRMVRTSLNSFVVLINRFLRSSTTVVEWLVVSLDMFPFSFLELQRSWRSTTAEFNVVMSCLIRAVSSWISIVGSSKTEVLFATANQDVNIKIQSANMKLSIQIFLAIY